ncbi:MAG: OmpH family outer membrane protein [Bacteroidetes bacterium]|nr:OmpH family outer membrane protein [Bacteroidota bacterium]
MKPERINTVLIIICMVLLVGGFWYFGSKQPKIAYVKTAMLYDGFDYKHELEKKLEDTKYQRKAILDSILMQLQALSEQLKANKNNDPEKIEKFQQMRSQYLAKEKQFSEDNQALAEKYSSDIWKQLNQYVTEYGHQHGFTYIFGADGSGALMAASNDKDITEDVKIFVNRRYNGKISD